MAMDFMDIRKRVYTFPKMGEKAYFIAIPTSSGTGSEVTPFAIITDADTGVKWPITDYELMPNMAIVDVDNAMTALRTDKCIWYRRNDTCNRSICIYHGYRLYRWSCYEGSKSSI